MACRDPGGPDHCRRRDHGAHRAQHRASVASHRDCRFSDEQSEQHSCGQHSDPREVVLTEDQRPKSAHPGRRQDGKDETHGARVGCRRSAPGRDGCAPEARERLAVADSEARRVSDPAEPQVTPEDDWAKETADRLDHLVGTIRSQTTDRVVSLTRVVVYGLLAAIVGLMAAVLFVVTLVRGLDEIIPQEVWLTYLIVGAIFTLVGLFLWSKRERRPAKV